MLSKNKIVLIIIVLIFVTFIASAEDAIIIDSDGTVTINNSLIIEPDGTVKIRGFSLVPIGAEMMWSSHDIPDGWILEDGSSYLITEYPALAAHLGTSFINPNDPTRFFVPNAKGVSIEGYGSQIITREGLEDRSIGANDLPLGEIREDEFQSHYHSLVNGNYVMRDGANNRGDKYSTQEFITRYNLSVGVPTDDPAVSPARFGDETHGSRRIVNFIIKADTQFP